MKINEILSVAGNGLGYVLSVVQNNEVLQIISFALNAILTCVIIGFRLWSWWKEASKDGKITKEEIDEAIGIVEDAKKKGHKDE